MKDRGDNMIEFKTDGPFDSNSRNTGNRLRIIGIGQAGIGALDQIVMYGLDKYDLLVVDTDQQTLEGSVVKQRMLLGAELTRGLGCGGDHELAAEVADACGGQYAEAIADCDTLIISIGFGGATAGMVAPQIVKEAAKKNVRTLVVGTMPFGFESRRRLGQAMRTVDHLKRCADAVLVFSNDRITGLPQASGNIRQGFHVINQLTGRSIESLAQILAKRGLIQLSFADVRSLYGCLTHKGVIENCWAGSADSANSRDVRKLVDGVLNSPLLGDDAWEQADHAIVCLSGGRDLSLAQVQNVLTELQKRLPENFPVATGATIEEGCKDKVRMTLLLARTKAPASHVEEVEPVQPETLIHDTVPLPNLAALQKKAMAEEPEPVEEEQESGELEIVTAPRAAKSDDSGLVIPKLSKPKKHIAKQEELPFDVGNRGRFEKSIETIYEGENLDQPTFRRRKLAIRI